MNKNYGQFGYAIQSALGTPAEAPTVSYYASADSDGMNTDKATDTLNLTKGGKSTAVSSYTSEVNNEMATTTLGFADLLGLMLTAAMGTDTVTAGEGEGVYVHTITEGEALPYLTAFEQKGSRSADVRRMSDAKVNTISMTAEGVAPISFDYHAVGCDTRWLPDVKTWNGPAFDIANGYYTLADAEVLFSLASDTPGAVPAGVNLSSLEFEINNNVEAQRKLGVPSPSDQQEGASEITATLTGTTDSTELYREVITGSKTGEAVAAAVVTGSLQIKFQHSTNDAYSFTLKMPAIPWTCEVPSVSTDGGPFDLSLSTEGALATGETGAATFIVVNGVEKYLS